MTGWEKEAANVLVDNSSADNYDIIKQLVADTAFKNLKGDTTHKTGVVLSEELLVKQITKLVMIQLKIEKAGEEAAKVFAGANMPEKFYVELLFSKDPQAVIDRVARDLALFDLVRICNEPELAKRIQDEDIRKKSLDNNVKSIFEFWDQ